jgi:hypothetical protein
LGIDKQKKRSWEEVNIGHARVDTIYNDVVMIYKQTLDMLFLYAIPSLLSHFSSLMAVKVGVCWVAGQL